MMKILFVTCYGMSILDYIVFINTFETVHDIDLSVSEMVMGRPTFKIFKNFVVLKYSNADLGNRIYLLHTCFVY